MKSKTAVASLGFWGVLAWGQAPSTPVVLNQAEAKWVREAKDPPGAESVVIREDSRTGGLDLLVSFPAGHVFRLHSHESNERIVLIEGRLSLRERETEKLLDPGGFAYLPAREVQRLSCVSKTRCVFYIFWDGSPRSYAK